MDIILRILFLAYAYVRDTLYLMFVVYRSTAPISIFASIIVYGTFYYFFGMYFVYFVGAWYVASCLIYILSSRYRYYHRTTVMTWRRMTREY